MGLEPELMGVYLLLLVQIVWAFIVIALHVLVITSVWGKVKGWIQFSLLFSLLMGLPIKIIDILTPLMYRMMSVSEVGQFMELYMYPKAIISWCASVLFIAAFVGLGLEIKKRF